MQTNFQFFSRRQKYRDTYSLTGHSIAAYERKKQLSHALALIKSSDIPFAEIAYTCGFSSQQALNRAVKTQLGMTPSEYKKSPTYYYFPNTSHAQSCNVTIASETIPETVCFRYFTPHFKALEDKALAALFAQIPAYDGRIFGRNGTQTGSKFCYELYLSDTSLTDLEGFSFCGIKSAFNTQLVSSVVKYNEEKINVAWDNLYNTWLPTSMFEVAAEPYFEEYVIKNASPKKLRLCIPIQKRDEDMKITIIQNPDMHFAVATANGYHAEKIAAKKVLDATAAHPLKTKEYLVIKKNNGYTCGVRVNSVVDFSDKKITLFTPRVGYYAMLESNVCGEHDLYAEILRAFAQDNNMTADTDSIFAVYDATERFDLHKIKFFMKIKFGTE